MPSRSINSPTCSPSARWPQLLLLPVPCCPCPQPSTRGGPGAKELIFAPDSITIRSKGSSVAQW